MANESVTERIEKQAARSMLRNAILRWETGAILVLTIAATVFLPDVIPFIPPLVWPLFGAAGEAAVIYAGLTDKNRQQRAIDAAFREKYTFSGIRDRNLLAKLNEAEQYRVRIQSIVDQQKSGILRDRLKSTADEVYTWVGNMVQLARRIDAFRGDQIIRRDLTAVPRDIENLKRRLALERDASVREQMTTTLESSQRQLEALQELKGRMERADLQLDHSLAALGTVYSQFLLIGSKDVDSDRTDRLSDDIRDQVLALQDIVDSLNEVYSSGGAEDVETITAARTRREQAAGR
jgi:hypothetical protein